MLYENIRRISKKKSYSMNRLEKDLGFSSGSICKWKTVKPSYEKIVKVANQLGVSIEELIQ